MLWGIDHSWTLFLDRDGVINVRLMGDYVKNREEFSFISGVPEAIVQFNNIFSRIFVVTNQQGIGKGVMTESNLLDVHSYMLDGVRMVGGKIDHCYFAPQLAIENSNMRKPGSGMALKAKLDFPEIDFSRSVMVGDSDSDIEFGKNLGMRTVKVTNEESDTSNADLYVKSLKEFSDLLI
jgi:D-glycero-D-manno-heptose 1,7-bisphosphate phosphatase